MCNTRLDRVIHVLRGKRNVREHIIEIDRLIYVIARPFFFFVYVMFHIIHVTPVSRPATTVPYSSVRTTHIHVPGPDRRDREPQSS